MRSNGIPDEMVRVIVGIYMGFECAVVDRSVISHRLTIKYGVKMGYMMSGFLFYCLGLGHEKGKAERRDKVESANSAGRP